MYTVQFSNDEPASIEWDDDLSSQGIGPGWFTVPAKKIARRCLDAQVITQTKTHEQEVIGNFSVVSSWDTLSHMYFSLEVVPYSSPGVEWDAEADVVFRGDGGVALTFKGVWMWNGLIQMVYSKDGFGQMVAYTAFTKA